MSAAEIPIIRTSKLTSLTPDQVRDNWNVIAGLLEKATDRSCGRISLQDVQQAIVESTGIVLIAWDPKIGEVYAAFFCEIDEYKTGCKCWNIALCGGRDVEDWGHLWIVMKEVAKNHGCDQIEISGRKGWGRVLGLKETARLYIEDL